MVNGLVGLSPHGPIDGTSLCSLLQKKVLTYRGGRAKHQDTGGCLTPEE